MKQHIRRFSFLLVLIGSICGPASVDRSRKVFAQDRSDASGADSQAQAVKKAAQYLYKPVDSVTPELKQIGFDPTTFSIDADTWQGFSAERKLATAFQYAEAAEPQRGGERFLALLSRSLANQYEAAYDEPALKPYIRQRLQPADRVEFKKPPSNISVADLPADVKEAIRSSSKYISRNSVSSFIERHTGLPKGEVFDIATSSSHPSEMLERAISKVESEKRRAVVERMVDDIAKKYEAASYEESFRPFLKQNETKADNALESHPPNRSVELAESFEQNRVSDVKPRSLAEAPAAKKYPEVMKGKYSEPGSRRFDEMRKDVRGFGGIVLGNRVEAAKDLQKEKLLALSYAPKSGNDKHSGTLEFAFANGKTLRFGPVLAEDAYVAQRIVFETTEGAPQWKMDEGIGIVGIESPVSRFTDYGPKGVQRMNVSKLVLHPAAIDLDLGNAAIITDATPRNGRSLLYQAVFTKHGREAAEEVSQLFQSRAESLDHDAYMFIDVPLQVFTEGESLLVRRQQDEASAAIPEGIRRSAFIELRIMAKPSEVNPEDRYDREFASAIYQEMPVLATSYYDFQRINQFAAVLSLFRWAKQCDASSTNMPDRPHSVRTADAILTGSVREGEAIRAADMELVTDQQRGGKKALLNRIELLEKNAKFDTKKLQEVVELNKKRDEITAELYRKLGENLAALNEQDRAAAEYWVNLKSDADP